MNRQIFFCSIGGFDTHSDQIATQASLFQQLSQLDPESASAIKIKREVDRIYDALLAASFQEFGEHEIAMLLREHPTEFWRLYNEGARQFSPEANPALGK